MNPKQPPEQYPIRKGAHLIGNMMVWKEHYLGSQETWIPALSLEQNWHTTLDKAFNLSRPQFSHLFLRALNEIMVSSSPFTSNSTM